MDAGNSETILSPNERRKRPRSKTDILNRNLSKYPLLPPCQTNCFLSCKENIEEETRSQIRHNFRSMEFEDRRKFLNEYVTVLDVKRRKKNTKVE